MAVQRMDELPLNYVEIHEGIISSGDILKHGKSSFYETAAGLIGYDVKQWFGQYKTFRKHKTIMSGIISKVYNI